MGSDFPRIELPHPTVRHEHTAALGEVSGARMTTWRKDARTYSIFRVRRCNPDTGEVLGTRYYVQQPAAKARAQRWERAGYLVHVDRAGPIRFQGYR
jgi:hypothetical protein